MKQFNILLLVMMATTACNRSATNTASPGATSSLSSTPADYTPRIGVAVSTNSRTCIAIRNGNLAAGTVITLVSPIAPVISTQATIAGISQEACPITQNVDTTMSNYNVTAQNPVQKLTPMIAVVGTPTFTVNNNVGQADLDQNGRAESFRACSADNGVHLTVWKGAPLQGTLLWHGYYYEAANPAIGPSCTPAEMPAS
ncbi:MAG TPA: hypothetical protein VFA65_00370 [Bryobacteraceae bacterium]|nr:hypothetical protein [Bryobacteraceae bacterium]